MLPFTFITRLASRAVLCVLVIAGFMAATAEAVCTPSYSQESFRKVYRNNKFFMQGLEDLTGDGKPDAYGYELQANNTYQNIVILPNNGSGGFGDPVIIPTTFAIDGTNGRYQEIAYGAIALGNMNGDGRKDIVVRSGTSFYTFLSDGVGGYTQSQPTTVFNKEFVVFAGDLNGDGVGDLVTEAIASFYFAGTLQTQNNSLMYRLGNADGTFGTAATLKSAANISPVVGDFNGDGKPDVAFTRIGTTLSYDLEVFLNVGGSGLFSPLTPVVGIGARTAVVGDVNGDGKLDIAGSGTYPNLFTTAALINNGSGVFTKQVLSTANPPGIPADYRESIGYHVWMDYDGDGKKDVVKLEDRMPSISGYRMRYQQVNLNDGTGNFTGSYRDKPFIGVPGDINGDGKDDEVIFVNSTNGVERRASASNETAVIVRQNVCTAPTVRGQNKIIDFGGDGVSDISNWHPASGLWSFFSNVNARSFYWGGANFGDIPIPGDYDGDGKTDAAVFRNPTGDWHIQRSSDGAYMGLHWGATGDIPIPGDFNGDGKADIAVFRPSNGDWYIYFTGTNDYLFTHFGATGDIPIPRDFDGDGKHDIAVFRPSSGDWFGLKSTTGDFFGIHWGATGDIPIPGDYDMDGKDDIAVFRPSDHYWYVLRSFDGGADFISYGLAVDKPMLVDSDGDGVMELTTFRPNQNTTAGDIWYASNQPFFTWAYFGVPGYVPLRHLMSN